MIFSWLLFLNWIYHLKSAVLEVTLLEDLVVPRPIPRPQNVPVLPTDISSQSFCQSVLGQSTILGMEYQKINENCRVTPCYVNQSFRASFFFNTWGDSVGKEAVNQRDTGGLLPETCAVLPPSSDTRILHSHNLTVWTLCSVERHDLGSIKIRFLNKYYYYH